MLHWYGGLLNFLVFSFGTENFEAEAVRLFWFSVTPGKLCLAPKVFLGGLRDRTVEYTTWLWEFTKFAKSFYSNRKFRSRNCSAVLIFRNPRKRMFGPKSASWGVTESYCWAYYMGTGIPVVFKSFYLNREFRILNCSAVLIFRNPQKAMFGPESASWGVTGSYSWIYYIWVWGNTKFSTSFHCNREFRSQSCSAALNFRNPQKAMFGPESASCGVTGSYRSVCYIWVWGNTKLSKSFHCNREFRSQSYSAALNFRNPQKARFGPESASWGVTGSYRSVCYIGMGDY